MSILGPQGQRAKVTCLQGPFIELLSGGILQISNLSLKLHTWMHMWHRTFKMRVNSQLNACFADEDFVIL